MGVVLFLGVYNGAFVFLDRAFFQPLVYPLSDSSRVILGIFWNALVVVPLGLTLLIGSVSTRLRRISVQRPERATREAAWAVLPASLSDLGTFVRVGMFLDVAWIFLVVFGLYKGPSALASAGPATMASVGLAAIHMSGCTMAQFALGIYAWVRSHQRRIENLIRSGPNFDPDGSQSERG
jgi:hypothetical protein